MIVAASLSARAAFCSPSAAITYNMISYSICSLLLPTTPEIKAIQTAAIKLQISNKTTIKQNYIADVRPCNKTAACRLQYKIIIARQRH